MVALILVSMLSSTNVEQQNWGATRAGEPVAIYTLSSANLTARVTTYGARLVSVVAPDRAGAKADVVLGYDDVASYESDRSTYFGAIVGRYGNRLAGGAFTLDGTTYHVPTNNNGNALHGGTEGFDRKVWSAKTVKNGVELSLTSPDGDMGFPGELTLTVRYTLDGNALRIDYSAKTNKATVVNVTNHAYFNLAGNGTVLAHELKINADRYTAIDAKLIPTGELPSVAQTPFDFRKPTPIGARIAEAVEQLRFGNGYDHNFVLTGKDAVDVYEPTSGRTLHVTTTEPGVQFYSGNFLDGSLKGRGGVAYAKHSGFCLETQHFPDAPNHPTFPSTVLRPGKPFQSTTTFTFGVRK